MNPLTDDTLWNSWLAENAARFLLFARQQTRCPADAEDVLQESLVEAWKRSEGTPAAPLVYATIRRRAIDLGRRTDRRMARELAEAVGRPEAWFIPQEAEEEAALLLEREMQRLPDPQREVLILKVWGELTFIQIAQTLELPQGTVASRYRLAMESLRQSMNPISR